MSNGDRPKRAHPQASEEAIERARELANTFADARANAAELRRRNFEAVERAGQFGSKGTLGGHAVVRRRP